MLINIIGFQICWFGLVYGGNSFLPIALMLLTLHFIFIADTQAERLLILSVTVIGILVDSVLHQLNFFVFNESHAYIPLWLGILWGCFACTLRHSLNFLSSSKCLQIVIGGGLAPLSYIAAVQFDAVMFSYSLPITYGILALIWSILFLVFFYLNTLLFKMKV